MPPIVKKVPRKRIDRDSAMTIALHALAFLAEQEERLARFLQLTGLNPAGLAAGVQTPDLLRAVLEHVSADESMLLMFAANSGIRAEDVACAIDLLSKDS